MTSSLAWVDRPDAFGSKFAVEELIGGEAVPASRFHHQSGISGGVSAKERIELLADAVVVEVVAHCPLAEVPQLAVAVLLLERDRACLDDLLEDTFQGSVEAGHHGADVLEPRRETGALALLLCLHTAVKFLGRQV